MVVVYSIYSGCSIYSVNEYIFHSHVIIIAVIMIIWCGCNDIHMYM